MTLRLKAFETLRVLVENAERLVTKETLLKQVWSEAVVEENNLNVNVSILRKALGEDANGQSYIETVPRVGYRNRCVEWLERALAIDPEETTILYNAACTYSLMGEKDQALNLLEKAVRNGYGHKEWLENDPDFASLRDHPPSKP